MNDEPPEVPEALLASEVHAICARYRIEAEEARRILKARFAKHPGLLYEIATRFPGEDVTRLGAYRRVIKDARKQVYYHLRRYQRDAEERKRLERQLERLAEASDGVPAQTASVIGALLETHVSTRERAPWYPAFYRQLFDLIEPPRGILDVGCGLHPLSYPFQAADTRPDVYVALDRAPDVVHTLHLFAPCARPTRLVAVCADLAHARWSDYLDEGSDAFDVAFLLKLVPVIHRTDRALLDGLAAIPARKLVVTASTEALTRRDDIRRREDRVLKAFTALSGRQVAGTFEIESEFGYVLL